MPSSSPSFWSPGRSYYWQERMGISLPNSKCGLETQHQLPKAEHRRVGLNWRGDSLRTSPEAMTAFRSPSCSPSPTLTFTDLESWSQYEPRTFARQLPDTLAGGDVEGYNHFGKQFPSKVKHRRIQPPTLRPLPMSNETQVHVSLNAGTSVTALF